MPREFMRKNAGGSYTEEHLQRIIYAAKSERPVTEFAEAFIFSVLISMVMLINGL
jgi:hypothetical protein